MRSVQFSLCEYSTCPSSFQNLTKYLACVAGGIALVSYDAKFWRRGVNTGGKVATRMGRSSFEIPCRHWLALASHARRYTASYAGYQVPCHACLTMITRSLQSLSESREQPRRRPPSRDWAVNLFRYDVLDFFVLDFLGCLTLFSSSVSPLAFSFFVDLFLFVSCWESRKKRLVLHLPYQLGRGGLKRASERGKTLGKGENKISQHIDEKRKNR